MTYTSLHNYSYYSLLQGLASPREIAAQASKLDMKSIALTDINNISGCIEFYLACQEKNIKSIIGSLITTSEGTLLLIALNNNGYINLLDIIAKLNSKSCYKNGKLTIKLDQISKFNLDNIICITGHEGSGLYNSIVNNFKIKSTWKDLAKDYINKLQNLFKNNIYIEWQFSESDSFSDEIKKIYHDIATFFGLTIIACPRTYYLEEPDKELQQILRSLDAGASLTELNKINDANYKFFNKNYRFYLPSYTQLKEIIPQEFIDNTNKISNLVEDYKLLKSPTLPKFKTPNNESSEEYFANLCRQGWLKKIKPILKSEQDKIEYSDRIKEELKVLKKANLFDYFLILHDILKYAKKINCFVGGARGSVAGCLTAYLLDITNIDSLKYKLLFTRFFNAGRISGKKTSLPDIDTDFEACHRDDILKYIIKKYGKENAMQIATYGTLAGRAALKAVFRAYKTLSFSEQNEICKYIPDRAKISDHLQQMKKEGKQDSPILWALENKSSPLKAWCIINKEGKFEGPLSDYFSKAIKLEGIISTQSKHAAGICIGSQPIKTLCPIVFDPKTEEQIIGAQMGELESVSLVKMDILSLSTLDRLKSINER